MLGQRFPLGQQEEEMPSHTSDGAHTALAASSASSCTTLVVQGSSGTDQAKAISGLELCTSSPSDEEVTPLSNILQLATITLGVTHYHNTAVRAYTQVAHGA
ncbi:hypothetical protein NDU88_000746 [Pleurodeles waltl]|uniref:Uncharacterized protein n=1 Tax=Pleurodeles waltl TaxID=8319 RepID=A0AAV7Q7U3_PLEWA|nr:hypothetical protein NDU88_000746 [Pleurodeles waltl]